MKQIEITRTGAKVEVGLVLDKTAYVLIFDSPTLERNDSGGTRGGTISGADDEPVMTVSADGSFEMMSEAIEYTGIPGTLPRGMCDAWIAYIDAGRPDSITIAGDPDLPGPTGTAAAAGGAGATGGKKKRRQTRRRRA